MTVVAVRISFSLSLSLSVYLLNDCRRPRRLSLLSLITPPLGFARLDNKRPQSLYRVLLMYNDAASEYRTFALGSRVVSVLD